MKEFVKISIEKLKLVYLWFTKILFAKDHFRVAPWTKLRLNLQGYLVDQYAIYDFKHRSQKEYLSEFDWYRSRRINGDYSFILNNKLVCAEMLGHYTRVPETYACRVGKRPILLRDGTPATQDNLLQLLRRHQTAILKPIGYGKGKGVHIITFDDGFHLDHAPITERALWELLQQEKDWFLSEYIRQATYLNEIYPHTANTIRLITLRHPETQAFEVFFAVQRIGTAKTFPVDNGSRGGLVAKIDLQTGTLSEARTLHTLDVLETHPDSQAPIKGVQIPNWQALQQDILALSNRFAYLSFIAWDLLVTDDGFCVIEANTSSGVNIIQLWGGQRNGPLGDFFRAHGIIR